MSFHLIDHNWREAMLGALTAGPADMRIACPFIKHGIVRWLLQQGKPKSIRVVTRFNLVDFYNGVSDTAALRLLIDRGAEVRGVRNLHAKVYLFGVAHAMVSSANLTAAALDRNHEFGFEASDPAVVAPCSSYFESIWQKAGPSLTAARLTGWETKLAAALSAGSKSKPPAGLSDEGVDLGIHAAPMPLPPLAREATQWFVKFFGESTNRASRSMSVIDELDRSGSHWACTYPIGKRPRRVRDGAVMFPARMVKDPDDIILYGRAIGLRHREGVDDATTADITARTWKSKWPHYVRVHHGQYVAGTLANGVSLNGLMEALGANAFAVTKRNLLLGTGNTDPRRAYRQQAGVELTPEAAAWSDEQLEAAFVRHGTLTPTDMDGLDWPSSLTRAVSPT
jgi:hypothetical protein